MAQIAVTFKGHFGDDLDVVNAAKVSFGKESKWADVVLLPGARPVLKPADDKLIRFLARGMTSDDWADCMNLLGVSEDAAAIEAVVKDIRAVPMHRSPFNHCFASFHVKAPLFVARQLVKHEYLTWNEISGRYVTFKPEFYAMDTYRRKVDNKKQGSGDAIEGDAAHQLHMLFDRNHADAFTAYLDALELGLCEEQARSLLPLDLMTEWRWSGTLGAWAKMAAHRLRDDAQHESRLVAQQIDAVMAQLFPVSWGALVHGDY